jgi:hypothetical protein
VFYFQSGISIYLHSQKTVAVAQLVRALDCGSRGRGFEPLQLPYLFWQRLSPQRQPLLFEQLTEMLLAGSLFVVTANL